MSDATATLSGTNAVELQQVVSLKESAITHATWAPDGRSLAMASGHLGSGVRLFVWRTGEAEVSLQFRLEGQGLEGLGWTPDSRYLVLILAEGETTSFWDSETLTFVPFAPGLPPSIPAWACSNGGLAWVARQGSSPAPAPDLCDARPSWSPDGSRAAFTSNGSALLTLLDMRSGKKLGEYGTGSARIVALTWAPDGLHLAAGLDDLSVLLLSGDALESVSRLEGLHEPAQFLSFSADNRLMAAATKTGFAVWEVASHSLLTTQALRRDSSIARASPILFQPGSPERLAVLDGPRLRLSLYRFDYEGLLREAMDSVKYLTARIIVVGKVGVGKSSLAWRLTHPHFRHWTSTHGQQHWVFDKAARQTNGMVCEAVLWDLGGQPDYRILHSLFLDQADLALVLFDPTDRTDPLEEVVYWLNALGKGCRTILVGTKIDRGGLTISREAVEQFCRTHGVTGGYVATSALHNDGMKELTERIREQIPWSEMTPTTSTRRFKQVKDAVLKAHNPDPAAGSSRQRVLLTPAQLLELVREEPGAEACTEAELHHSVNSLVTHGAVNVLHDSAGEQFILLKPVVLINLAARFILAARQNERGLGALAEEHVRRNLYNFSELRQFRRVEQTVLLDAALTLFLTHNICFRHQHGVDWLLIFPGLITERKPAIETAPVCEDISYVITGRIENVYASLVVLMGYTNMFLRTAQWQNQAEYQMADGQVCGFRRLVEIEREGTLGLVLYYGSETKPWTRNMFQGLFDTFLNDCHVKVARYPVVVCPKCGFKPNRVDVIGFVDTKAAQMFCPRCGVVIALPAAGAGPGTATAWETGKEIRSARRRTRFESIVNRFWQQAMATKAPTCFISYAWGDSYHERWVAGLADDLSKGGVTVHFDRNEVCFGDPLGRFVSLIRKVDFVVPVMTEAYMKKADSVGPDRRVVATEVDQIDQRILHPPTSEGTVLPLLLQGDVETAVPQNLNTLVYLDFRPPADYFTNVVLLLLKMYRIRPDDDFAKAVLDDLGTATD